MASIMDLILRVMGNSGQFREDIQQDKVVLEDFINSVHDIDIDVKLEDADAKEKLDTFKAELDELHNKTANIDLDDAVAREKLEQFKLKLDDLRNEAVRINLDDEHAKEQLDEFKLKWDDLRNQAIEIKVNDIDAKARLDALQEKEDKLRQALVDVDVNDADAKVRIDDIKAKIDSIHDARVNVDVDDADAILQIDELDRKLDGLEARIQTINRTPIRPGGGGGGAPGNQGGGGMGVLVGSILTTLPAISPLAAVAAAAIGSIGSAFAAATAGAVGFGAVAKSNISAVTAAQGQLQAAQQGVIAAQQQLAAAKTYQEWLVATENLQKAHVQLAQAQKSIPPDLMSAVNALNQFQAQWKSWTASFRPTVLSAFEKGLTAIEALMRDMSPVINASGKAINQLLAGLDKDLSSQGAAKFFNTLAQTTGPAILSFGTAAANIFKGLAGIFEAFAPTFPAMEKGLDGATASFAKWGQGLSSSKSFQSFLDYVKQAAPQVLELLKNLGDTVMNVLKAMAPAGTNTLGMVNGLLKLVNALLGVNPLVGQLGVGVMQAVGVFKLISPIAGFGTALGKAGTAMKDMNGFIGVAVKVFPGLSGAVRMFGGVLGGVGKAITLLGGPWGILIAAIIAGVLLVVTHWKQISAEAQKLWNDLKSMFSGLGKDIENIWNGIVSWFSGMWSRLRSFFAKWGPDLLLVLAPFIGIPLFISQHWGTIEKWFSDMWTRMKKFFGKWGMDILMAIVPFIGIPLYIFQHWGVIEKWFSDMWGRVIGGVKSFASDIMADFTKLGSDIENFFTNLAKSALSWGSNIVHMIAQGISNAASEVKSAVSSVASSIGNFLGFHSPTKEGPGSDADHWMPNLMNMMIDGIQVGAPKVRAALNQVIIPPGSAAMMGGAGAFASAGLSSLESHVHIYGNVYSTDDISAAAQQGAQKVLKEFAGRVKVKGRTMGVSN